MYLLYRLVIGMVVIAVKQHARTRFIMHVVILFVWIQAQKISRELTFAHNESIHYDATG